MNNKVYIFSVAAILSAVLFWSSYQMVTENQPEPHNSVSVIVSESTNDRWNVIREGMEQAAVEHNIELSFISTEAIEQAEELQAIMQRELELGAKGIILEPVDDTDMHGYLEEIGNNTALVLMQSDVEPGDVYSSVLTDNSAMVEALKQALSEKYKERLFQKKIGIIRTLPKQYSTKEKEEMIGQWMVENNLEVSWNISTEVELINHVKAAPVDIILALDNSATETAIDVLLEEKKENTIDIFGMGYSQKAVYYLDREVLDHLIVSNDFNMGYMSIETIAQMLQYGNRKLNQKIDVFSINSENLYGEEYQNILFPLVQ